MSELANGGRIADPVHGYVDFTPVERAILDHPVAQRMRYISQNGLAHLVFPEARTSRFSHSLGAMHLASAFFTASLRNTTEAVRARACSAIREALRVISNPDVATIGDEIPSAMLDAHRHVAPEFVPFVKVAEQSLRLAALFHDLGHLPFSHDFEYGLEEYWHGLPVEAQKSSSLTSLLDQRVGRTQVHERIGHELSRVLFEELFASLEPPELKAAVDRALSFAHQILEAGYPDPRGTAEYALNWLHSIVDGELDCDRSDYLLRDALHHGFDFASYDLRRLLDNIVVAFDGDEPVVAVKPQGLSSVESFLLARFRSNKYGIRHHKVVQIGLGLRRVIAELLGQGLAELEEFKADLGSLGAAAIGAADRTTFLERFAGYDEIWWTTRMRAAAAGAPPAYAEWLNLVCWRGPGPTSFWKRRAEFPAAAEISEWNDRLPDLDSPREAVIWAEAIAELRDRGVLVVRHRFIPWAKDRNGNSTIRFVSEGGALVPAHRLSSLVDALPLAWGQEVQVQAFAASSSALSKEEVFERLTAASEAARAVSGEAGTQLDDTKEVQ